MRFGALYAAERRQFFRNEKGHVFERLTLDPGETKTVNFLLGPAELGYWSTNAGKWIQEAETFDIWVGADSLATLHADLEVVASSVK